MSAHGNAHSCYGVDKLTIERLLDPERDLAIRPGFILGYGGTFQGLARILSKLPLLPLFYGGSLPIHTVHVDDACVSILKLVEREITGVWPVGEETPVTIRHFFGSVATWLGRRPLFLPLPGAPFLHLLRMAERCGLQPPLGSDNLLGLRGLIAYDLSQTVRALDFRPTSLRESLSRLDPAVLMESLCPPSVRTRRLS
jgi:NADH dehydrogenase